MAQGNEAGGFLGGLNAGDAGDGEDIALGQAAAAEQGEGGPLESDVPGGDGGAHQRGLGGDIHHAGGPGGSEVGEAGRGASGGHGESFSADRFRGEEKFPATFLQKSRKLF